MLIRKLDEKLSKPAGRIVSVLLGAAIAWAAYETTIEGPLALPISEFQANHLFDGSYFPMLTILLLSLPFCAPIYGLGFALDYLNEQGLFAPEEPAAPHPPTDAADAQA